MHILVYNISDPIKNFCAIDAEAPGYRENTFPGGAQPQMGEVFFLSHFLLGSGAIPEAFGRTATKQHLLDRTGLW